MIIEVIILDLPSKASSKSAVSQTIYAIKLLKMPFLIFSVTKFGKVDIDARSVNAWCEVGQIVAHQRSHVTRDSQ